jgi:hypothetical protein
VSSTAKRALFTAAYLKPRAMSSSASRRTLPEDRSYDISPPSVRPPRPGQNRKSQPSFIACTPTQLNTPSSSPHKPQAPRWQTEPSLPSSPTRPSHKTAAQHLIFSPSSEAKIRSAPTGRAISRGKRVGGQIQASEPALPNITSLHPKPAKSPKKTLPPPQLALPVTESTIPNKKPTKKTLSKSAFIPPKPAPASKSKKVDPKPVEAAPQLLDEAEDGEWDKHGVWIKSRVVVEREERERRSKIEEEKRKNDEADRLAEEKKANRLRHERELREMKIKKDKEEAEQKSRTESQVKESQFEKAVSQTRTKSASRSVVESVSSGKRKRDNTEEEVIVRSTPELVHERTSDPAPAIVTPASKDQNIFGKRSRQSLVNTSAHLGLYKDGLPNVLNTTNESQPAKRPTPLFLPTGSDEELSDTEVDEIEDPVDRSRTRRSQSRKSIYHINDDEEVQMPTSAQPSRIGTTTATSDIRGTGIDPFPYMKDGRLDPDYPLGTPQLSPRARVSPSQDDPFTSETVVEEPQKRAVSEGPSKNKRRKVATYSKRHPQVFLGPRQSEPIRFTPEPRIRKPYDGAKREHSTSYWVDQDDDGEEHDIGHISDMSYEDEDGEGDPHKGESRSKRARGRGRNGEWPEPITGMSQDSQEDWNRQRKHAGSLRPVSERFHLADPSEFERLPRPDGNDDAHPAPGAKEKRSSRKRRLPNDIRQMPRPELRMSKRSRVDENMAG